MARPLRRLLHGLAVLTLVLATTSSAEGQQRVAVLGFTGPNAGAARAAVKRVLAQDYEIVELVAWNEAAARLNARGTTPRNLAKVADDLGVRAIVAGGVSRAGRTWSLSVVVRDGASGEIVGRRGGAMPAPTRAGAVAGTVARNITPFIEEARGASGGAGSRRGPAEPDDDAPPPRRDDDDDDDRYSDIERERPPAMGGRPQRQAADEESPVGGRGRRARASADEEDDPDERADAESGDDGDDDDDRDGAARLDDVEPRRDRSSSSNGTTPWGWLEIGVEVNGASRNFNVPINPSCDTSNREQAAFESSVYPEIGGRVAFYPGGIFTARWASNIGIEASYHHHLYLKVLNRRQNREVEAEQYAFSAGGTYRIAVGNADRGITIWPRIGFGRYHFFLGDVGNDIVPPFTYDHIYLGINTFIPLATRHIGIEIGGQYNAVFNIGQYAIEAYNASGQLPSTNGFLVNAGLGGQIVAGLRWRVGFEFFGFISTHQGKGRGWGVDPSTECDGECVSFPGCVNTSTPDRRPVTGGIFTTDSADDLAWRLVFALSYRVGWNPNAMPGARGQGQGAERRRTGGGWYDDGRGREPEGDPEDDWDDGDW